MERYLTAIELSIATENWYSAISLALTIPDICGWLDDPNIGSQRRFRRWFDQNLSVYYQDRSPTPGAPFMTSGDCYALRCAISHEGGGSIIRQSAREVLSRIVFSTTGSHRIRVGPVLMLNVQEFCREICIAARAWVAGTQHRTDIQQRLQELISVQTGPFALVPGVYIGR